MRSLIISFICCFFFPGSQWDLTRHSTALPATGRCSRCTCGALKGSTVESHSASPWRRTTRLATPTEARPAWTTGTAGPRWPPTDRRHRCWPTWRPTGRTSRSDSCRRRSGSGWPCTRTTRAAPATARGLPPTHSTRPTSKLLPVRIARYSLKCCAIVSRSRRVDVERFVISDNCLIGVYDTRRYIIIIIYHRDINKL